QPFALSEKIKFELPPPCKNKHTGATIQFSGQKNTGFTPRNKLRVKIRLAQYYSKMAHWTIGRADDFLSPAPNPNIKKVDFLQPGFLLPFQPKNFIKSTA
ncbi:MAG: hypothetical protein LBV76_04115, partial [Deltaproteobacteria bacterium]|nr:hypothetical protein [Deltaproteobacteria bacterium]